MLHYFCCINKIEKHRYSSLAWISGWAGSGGSFLFPHQQRKLLYLFSQGGWRNFQPWLCTGAVLVMQEPRGSLVNFGFSLLGCWAGCLVWVCCFQSLLNEPTQTFLVLQRSLCCCSLLVLAGVVPRGSSATWLRLQIFWVNQSHPLQLPVLAFPPAPVALRNLSFNLRRCRCPSARLDFKVQPKLSNPNRPWGSVTPWNLDFYIFLVVFSRDWTVLV